MEVLVHEIELICVDAIKPNPRIHCGQDEGAISPSAQAICILASPLAIEDV
jgi:hypothetical protein